MKILISPRCIAEARMLVELGVDIIDVKNPDEGSLGAPFPNVVQEIVAHCETHGVPTSATLGDLPFKPGTGSLAAFGLARLGVRFVKAGLYGPGPFEQASELIRGVCDAVRMVDATICVVAAGYADYRTFGGLTPRQLLQLAATARCGIVMLDVAHKQTGSLFDLTSAEELRHFIAAARDSNLKVALAGSIGVRHIKTLARLQPDIVGVRGALCPINDRKQQIDPVLTRDFLKLARSELGSDSGE